MRNRYSLIEQTNLEEKIWRNSPAGQIISSKIILELLWAYQAKMCRWHIFSFVLFYTGMKKASFVLTIIKRTKESRRRLSTTLQITSLKIIEFTSVASKEYDFCTSSFTWNPKSKIAIAITSEESESDWTARQDLNNRREKVRYSVVTRMIHTTHLQHWSCV